MLLGKKDLKKIEDAFLDELADMFESISMKKTKPLLQPQAEFSGHIVESER